MKKAWPHIKCVLFIVVLAVVILVCDYLFAESGYIRFVLNDVNSSNEDVYKRQSIYKGKTGV